MRFQDPLRLDCHDCGVAQSQPVKSLLALTARCDSCGKDFRSIGLEMRKTLGDWTTYIGKIELAIALENKFEVQISDPELDASETVAALALVVARKLRGSAPASDVATAALATLTDRVGFSGVMPQLNSTFHELFSEYDRADA